MAEQSTATVVDPQGKAKALYEARRTRRPIAPFTDTEPHLTMADGYAIQAELVPMLLADGDEIVGYKVGLTSLAMQRLIGVDSPDFGPVLASTRYANGGDVPMDRFISPKMEAEITYVMGERLQGPGVTLEDARRAVSGAAASMEIVDSRVADWRVKLADTVADLASNGAMVIPDEFVPVDAFDSRLVGMVLSRNGEVIDTGAGAAALGDPLEVVAWLANVLGERGLALEPGHLVMTGALHAAVPLAAGDHFLAEFDRLGSVTLNVVDSLGG
ncbi:2-keto-4-pentenoate hydratase [Pseudonocardia halophobica]|uniref:2-keto-4-pentenoate hydratase n=1 Tax=Pseudonocardia halophobica TaxID=29401 RepID=UPI003D925591